MKASSWLLSAALAFGGAEVSALTLSVEAFDNATVQPGGPRSGSSGKAFFNIEGSANGSFASYGVARFDIGGVKRSFDLAFGAGAWTLDAVSLALTQSNAGFTTDGPVSIAHSNDDLVGIQSGTSPLTHPATGDFADLGRLLDYAFVEVATGTVEQHTLFQARATPSAGTQQLVDDIMLDGVLTLLLLDGNAGVAATYAGYTNFTLAGPTLSLTASAVPVPTALTLLVSGLGLLAVRRRVG